VFDGKRQGIGGVLVVFGGLLVVFLVWSASYVHYVGEGRGVLGLNKNTVEKRERRFLTFMKMILSTTNLNAMKVHKAAAIDKGESIPG